MGSSGTGSSTMGASGDTGTGTSGRTRADRN